MATTTPIRHQDPPDVHDRAQPPLRWPHLDLVDLTMVIVWAAGLVVALLLPATLIDPTADTAPAGHIPLVFGVVLLCAVAMIGSVTALYRRTRQAGVLVLCCVPTAVCIIYSILITIAKIQN